MLSVNIEKTLFYKIGREEGIEEGITEGIVNLTLPNQRLWKRLHLS